MNIYKEILKIEYENGIRNAIQLLFSEESGLGWKKSEESPKTIKPIYISCDEIDFNNHCCLNCHADNHAGDYDDTMGRMKKEYIESRHGLIIFYCCCEHQEIENLLKVLDKHVEKIK